MYVNLCDKKYIKFFLLLIMQWLEIVGVYIKHDTLFRPTEMEQVLSYFNALHYLRSLSFFNDEI